MGQNQLETYLDIWLDNIGYTVLFGWFVSITWITIDHKMSLSERIRSYKDWTVSLSTCLFIHVGMRMSQSENGGTHWEAYSSDILAGTQAFQKIKIIQKSDNFTTSFSRVHSSTFFNSWHTVFNIPLPQVSFQRTMDSSVDFTKTDDSRIRNDLMESEGWLLRLGSLKPAFW